MIPTAEISSSNVGVSSRPSSIAGPPREIQKKFPKFSIVKLLPIIQIHFLKKGQFFKDNEAKNEQKMKDKVRKFQGKPKLIFVLKTKNGMVDYNCFPFYM